MAIYDHALTTQDIQSLYYGQSGDNLVAPSMPPPEPSFATWQESFLWKRMSTSENGELNAPDSYRRGLLKQSFLRVSTAEMEADGDLVFIFLCNLF